MKNRVVINICNKEYILLANEEEAYVKAVANRVNKMIEEAIYKNLRSTKADAAILTCLDLCDQNVRLKAANDNLQSEIVGYLDEISLLNKKIAKYEHEKAKPKTYGKTAKNSVGELSVTEVSNMNSENYGNTENEADLSDGTDTMDIVSAKKSV